MTPTTRMSLTLTSSTRTRSSDVARSVLRLADQRRDVFPDRCVLSGVHTDSAMRMTVTTWRGPRWMLCVPGVVPLRAHVLRRPHVVVALPVSPAVCSRWRRRVALSQGVVTIGTVLIVTGSVVRATAPLAVGIVIFVSALALSARANRNWWITCTLDPTRAMLIVTPTHREFDAAAR